MSHVLWRLELCPASEINGDHAADIGNRKPWPANEFVIGELRIDPGEELVNARATALGEGGDLFVALQSR